MESNNKPLNFARYGDPKAPCIAVLDRYASTLTLVNLEGGNSDAVKLSQYYSCGIVTISNDVFAVTEKEILKIHSDGRKTTVKHLNKDLAFYSEVVSFQKKIYVIEPGAEGNTLCFNPANNGFINNLPECGLPGTWALTRALGATAATLDEQIYVTGSNGEDRAVQLYDPDSDSWTEISRMSVPREYAGAVVLNGRLYAVGGSSTALKKGNGLYENSIEVLQGDQWKMATKFESTDNRHYATVWPCGSFRSDHEDLPRDINNEYNQLRGKYEIRKSQDMRREGGEIKVSESKISVPQGALQQKKEVTFIARVDIDQQKGLLTLSEVLECRPPMTFDEPVTISMKTCISAHAGKVIPVILLTQEDLETKWIETEDLELDETSEVKFKIRRCSGMKIAAKGAEGPFLFRLISDFYIHSPTAQIAIIFSKTTAIHDAVEEVMHRRDFVNFAIATHEVTGDFGAEISLALKCKTPADCRVSDSSSIFKVDSKYLEKDKHAFYSDLEPEPSDGCNRINLKYKCRVRGEQEVCLHLKTEWPREKPRTGVVVGTGVTGAAGATGVVVGNNSTVYIDRDVKIHAGDVTGRAEGPTPKSSDDHQQPIAPAIHRTIFRMQIFWSILLILAAMLFRFVFERIYQI